MQDRLLIVIIIDRVRGGPRGVRHGPHRVLPGPHHLHAPPLPRLRGQGRPGDI